MIDEVLVTQHKASSGQRRPTGGRKIGLTNPAVQKQLGVDQPDYGMLFSDMDVPHGGTIDFSTGAQLRAEPELAFIIGRNLPYPDTSIAEVMRGVENVVPSLEIVGSLIADWDIRFVDTVADNASSAFFTLGPFGPAAGCQRSSRLPDGNAARRRGRQPGLRPSLPRIATQCASLAGTRHGLGRGRHRAFGSARSDGIGDARRGVHGPYRRFRRNCDPVRRMTVEKIKVAIIGSGNIRTDLMIKVMRLSKVLRMGALAGIDAASDGLARAQRLGVETTHEGLEGLKALPRDIRIVFDASSASAHKRHSEALIADGKRLIDLTPVAPSSFAVNLDANLDAANLNMVTCGGQATIPIVAAVNRVAKVRWGEIVASIASKSAGPGTRANIHEFTETKRHAIEAVGGAERGKAIIILNPAEPPLIMLETVHCLCDRPIQTPSAPRSRRWWRRCRTTCPVPG
ncbi:UNVERIFIED_ORG: acetaldehyde dehydrogenase (acetylating) [Rhizobium etli]